MLSPRWPRQHPVAAARAAGGAVALALATSLVGLVAAPPAGAVGLPGSTTTSPAPAATAPPAPATTAPPRTSPTTASPPSTGVPHVPTAGPPTTAPAPGQPPAPPVDVTPSVAAVDADLAQLAAISSYGQAKQAVATAQQGVAAAAAALTAAQAQARQAAARQASAAAGLGDARTHMAHLALAAYTGEAYASPGSDQASSPAGTVSTLGGQSPGSVADTEVLLGVVVEHTHRSFTDAQAVLRDAEAAAARAAAGVAAAQAGVGTAQGNLDQAQAGLKATTVAATTPGAAAEQAAATAPGAKGNPALAQPQAPPILGPSAVTAPELAAWYATTNSKPSTTVPIPQLAADYVTAGDQSGVRADLAFAQSIVETGYFSFPAGGQLTGADNNFAGIGACDSCAHGWSFPDAMTGVTAQMQLLEAYASTKPVPTPLVGNVGVGGCCPTWVALAGTWASSKLYAVEIFGVYKRILDWVIPQRLLAAGLAAPGSVTPAPPGTEASGPAGPPPAPAATPAPAAPAAPGH